MLNPCFTIRGRLLFILGLSAIFSFLASCGSNQDVEEDFETVVSVSGMLGGGPDVSDSPHPLEGQGEFLDEFTDFDVNPIIKTREKPVSTFSADVDTAAYSYVRRRLNEGYLPEKSAVRLEEMLNYFDYEYAQPKSADTPFLASVVVHDSPWAENRKLIHIGIQGYELKQSSLPDSNLVFLLDVSGSMETPDKLPLVKQSMEMLLSKLKSSDTVAIVVYAGAAGIVLPPTKVENKTKILGAVRELQAAGASAGVEGIQLAYKLAEKNFDPQAVNRIFLATDGDFNVGVTDTKQLQDLVERKKERGIYLSVLGFGQGNYRDNTMQTLAQNGNGVAAYIDTLSEAQKVLIHESTSSLFPIAEDLKLQVEFNPNMVEEYRLLGYETRALKREDFNNDKVDAGDIGSGHSVTAIYEVALAGSGGQVIDNLRYAQKKPSNSKGQELAYLKMRYKLPGRKKSKLHEFPIKNNSDSADKSLKREVNFATAVAGFAQILQGGKYLENWGYDHAIALALRNRGTDNYGYRNEFVQMVRKAKIAKSIEY